MPEKPGQKVDFMVGTMIELPRAALTADRIAEVAEFFSFGTNDLTQTTFGISRDDSGKFLPFYIENRILQRRSVPGSRSGRRRSVGAHGNRERAANTPGSQGRDLRRTWRRTLFGQILPSRRPELRFLLAVPRAHRPPGSSSGSIGI